MLYIHGANRAIVFPEICEIVTHYGLSIQHGGGRFSAGAGEGSDDICYTFFRSVDPHCEHVLGQPTFALRPAYRQPKREFLEADGVARILSVNAVDGILVYVDVHPPVVDIGTNAVFEPSLTV